MVSLTGNLEDWWEKDTGDKFVKRAQCIINQYGNFTAKQIGLNLNGITTQGENIADNGGIKEAYYGYGNYSATQLLRHAHIYVLKSVDVEVS